jgi:uncharacterized protein (DUF433 family)
MRSEHALLLTTVARYTSIMQSVVTSSREIMSGTPVFAGTRVPVQTLIDYLEGGDSIDDFLEGFPTVKREQVIAFLEEVKERVISPKKVA